MNSDQQSRISVLFTNDDEMLRTYGWQQYQGKLSIMAGGYTGAGLFKGQRVGYAIVPEQENDFIFTVAGEELGFLGCCIILLLFEIKVARLSGNSSIYSRRSAGRLRSTPRTAASIAQPHIFLFAKYSVGNIRLKQLNEGFVPSSFMRLNFGR